MILRSAVVNGRVSVNRPLLMKGIVEKVHARRVVKRWGHCLNEIVWR